jgi:exopolysaccharide biosynthesis polyprenyl glycosylphosphotransferase
MLWRRLTPPASTLVVGDGSVAASVRHKIKLFSDAHLRLSDGPSPACPQDVDDGILAGVERVVVATSRLDEPGMEELIARCRARQIKLSMVPPTRGAFGPAIRLSYLADLPVIEYKTWDVSQSTWLIKRTIDAVGSLLALVVLSPVFLLVALAIRVDSPGPIFFAQHRAGLGGKPFRMLKFRSMVSDAEARLRDLASPDDLRDPGFPFNFPDDPRITRVGRLLRRSSLDELPQLVNVLKGEMSLVGPRPEQAIIVQHYTDEHMFRLSVRPGITGPMQVSGRGDLTFEERLAIDRDYIDNLSLRRDLRLLALTFGAVLSGRGAV